MLNKINSSFRSICPGTLKKNTRTDFSEYQVWKSQEGMEILQSQDEVILQICFQMFWTSEKLEIRLKGIFSLLSFGK